MSVANKPLKVACINAPLHRSIISKYIAVKSMHDLYENKLDSVKLNDASIVVRVMSLNQCRGTKELDIDLNDYSPRKLKNRHDVNEEIERIFKLGTKCLSEYHKFLEKAMRDTIEYENNMAKITQEIVKYNHGQVKTAALFGKVYSSVKAAADVAVAVLSGATGPAGVAIGHVYGVATETASAVSDAQNVDLWTFQGTLSEPVTMAVDAAADMHVGKVGLALKSTSNFFTFLQFFLIGKDLHQNLSEFKS